MFLMPFLHPALLVFALLLVVTGFAIMILTADAFSD